MFCKHCGKELFDEAMLCPNCGTPTNNKLNSNKQETANQATAPLGLIALIFACIAFVTGIIFGAIIFSYEAALLLYLIGATSILPAFTAIGLAICEMYRKPRGMKFIMALIAIVLSAIVLLLLLLCGCIVTTGMGY